MCLVSFESWELILQFVSSGLTKLDETIGYCWCQLLWGGRYGCSNGRYGCTIVMSYIEINKAVSQWLLTVNLCVSVTWPLTCAFHIPCTHTPEIFDMHRGVCDKLINPSGDMGVSLNCDRRTHYTDQYYAHLQWICSQANLPCVSMAGRALLAGCPRITHSNTPPLCMEYDQKGWGNIRPKHNKLSGLNIRVFSRMIASFCLFMFLILSSAVL